MLRVNNLWIQNVGPFQKEAFDFSFDENKNEDIHIFIGPNGSGKTTILHAIASLFDHSETGFKEYRSNLFYKRFHNFNNDDNYNNGCISLELQNKIINKKPEYIYSSFSPQLRRLVNIYSQKNVIIEGFEPSAPGSVEFFNQPLQGELGNYVNAIISKDISNLKLNFAVFGYSGYRFISSTKIKLEEETKFNPLHLALEFVKKNDENGNISNWIISRYSKAAIEESRGNKALAETYRSALNCLIESLSELTDNAYTFDIQTNPWKVLIKHYDKAVEFDVLPDGMRSILSWMGDLLMRLDDIPWENKAIPVNHQDIILLLDEIEVHLHPKWQYRVLPLVKKVFPNAQIFVTTHSPFILNSIDNAKIHKLILDENGNSKLDETILSDTGNSYQYLYENVLETTHKFGPQTTKDLNRFHELDKEIVRKNFENEPEFKEIIKNLKSEGEEVEAIIASKLYRLKDVLGKDYLNEKNQ